MSINDNVSCRCFRGANGDVEHFIVITAPEHLSFEEQAALLHEEYIETQQTLGLSPETAIFERLYLSDPINQIAFLQKIPFLIRNEKSPLALSIIGQRPLPASKVGLFSYHIESPTPIKKQRLSPQHVVFEKNGIRHLWSTHMCQGLSEPASNEEEQTKGVFNNLIAAQKSLGGNLKDHTVRTWLFIKDVDLFYRGMVKGRRELFGREGLNENTHYIASTGIEGSCEHPFDLVIMDSYSNLDLKPGQMSYLNDFNHLCPTKEYNVTFERGTRIAYADRAHFFISGTASIDRHGKTVHQGDVMQQLELALINVNALLKAGGATLDDMMTMIVYLRDATDYARVSALMRERFPNIPMMFAKGAVCRPEWLVEIEGMAITPHDAPSLPSF